MGSGRQGREPPRNTRVEAPKGPADGLSSWEPFTAGGTTYARIPPKSPYFRKVLLVKLCQNRGLPRQSESRRAREPRGRRVLPALWLCRAGWRGGGCASRQRAEEPRRTALAAVSPAESVTFCKEASGPSCWSETTAPGMWTRALVFAARGFLRQVGGAPEASPRFVRGARCAKGRVPPGNGPASVSMGLRTISGVPGLSPGGCRWHQRRLKILGGGCPRDHPRRRISPREQMLAGDFTPCR